MKSVTLVYLLLTCVALDVSAQMTATISGRATDQTGAAIPAAQVKLENAVTGYRRQVETNQDGDFLITNIPFHTYQLSVEKTGFSKDVRNLSLRNNVPVNLIVPMQLEAARESVTVGATERTLLVDPEETGTHAQMNQNDIERLPTGPGGRGLETVIATFPGFAVNANGAIHPRGAHNQMTFVIDGMPINDQLTGAFANSVDPNIVQTVELFTGNIPAEFGNKLSAVANVTTKTSIGLGRRFSGSVTASASQFDNFGQVTTIAGEIGKVGYSAVLNTMKSNRFLDQVSLDNLHNGGNSQRGFVRFDYQASARDTVRLSLMSGRSSFQLANLRSQHAVLMDQRQLLRDMAMSLNWVHALSARTTFETTTSYRPTNAQFSPSAGDTPVTASQDRHLSTLTTGFRVTTIRGAHTVRTGVDWQHFPVSENFAFGITDPAFNDPASESFNSRLLPYDLTRNGTLFRFNARQAGNLYSAFAQDTIKAGRFQFSLGLRFDNYRFVSVGSQWQPRVGIAYSLKETGTVFRASYNRNLQTPPNENLLLSASPEAYALAPDSVREALGGVVAPIRSERQNVYELGVQQALFGKVSLNASYYHKDATDQQDNNNFFNTGVIFPITLKSIRINGAEGRIVVPPYKGFGGTVSFTHARAISNPPFSGGLYLGQDAVDALTSGPFVIDHDQKLSVQGILNYANPRGWYSTFSARYDSGLVAGFVDPAGVAKDPDYADLLPYVNLTAATPRVNPRTICDIVVGYERSREGRRLWDASFQVTNIFDRIGLYNFQSVFVGTRLVAPRATGVRLRFYF